MGIDSYVMPDSSVERLWWGGSRYANCGGGCYAYKRCGADRDHGASDPAPYSCKLEELPGGGDTGSYVRLGPGGRGYPGGQEQDEPGRDRHRPPGARAWRS